MRAEQDDWEDEHASSAEKYSKIFEEQFEAEFKASKTDESANSRNAKISGKFYI